jgi:hypothetical protein
MQIKSVRMTRESYCVSDDADAPHAQQVAIFSDATLEDVVRAVHQKAKAFMRHNAREAWVITSKHPIAVVCGTWDKPKMVLRTVRRIEDSVILTGTTAHMHFCLIQDTDPEMLYRAMDRLRYPYLRKIDQV